MVRSSAQTHMGSYSHPISKSHQPEDEARVGYEPLLRELLHLYPSLLQESPVWREGFQHVAHLAHGWYLRCHRGVEAILELDRLGYAEESAPIRRSVIEHCLALRWLAAEGDAILDAVAGGHDRNAQQRHDAVEQAGWTSIDLDLVKEIVSKADPPERDRSSDHLLHWQQRPAKYGDKHVTPGYLAETARSHPSYESAICYLEPPSRFLPASRDSVWQVPFCTTQLLEALLCVREAFDPAPWTAELESVLERYKSVTDAVRRQDGLPPVDWFTGTIASN